MYERKKRPSTKKAVKDIPFRPPQTEEEAEKLGVSLATKLAIQQLRDGTASSQIITHFLKIGSLREQAELEKTMHEIELLKAKKQAIESAEEQEKKYQEVIKAIAAYSGKDGEWEEIPPGEDYDY